jgi:hypothetical protein
MTAPRQCPDGRPPSGAELVGTVERWEAAGGVWRSVQRADGSVTVVLCTCTGDEEMQRLTSAAVELVQFVHARGGRSTD